MKKRIRILIFVCITVSVALGLIQFYFLNNTYRLYKKQALSEIKNELMAVERKIGLDSLRSRLMDKVQLYINTHPDPYLSSQILNFTDSALSGKVSEIISSNSLLKEHDVKYVTTVKAFIKFDPNQSMTNYPEFWFGNDTLQLGKYQLTNYTLTRTLKNQSGQPVFSELDTASSFDVLNWKSVLITRLAGLIFFSLLLVLGVITLFYIIIRNYIKQKKIAELKTDFVNNITHEFNTPLATLEIAIATLKKMNLTETPNGTQALSTIERQSNRLKSLIRQAVEFSKSGPEIEIQRSRTDGIEFINNILSDFKQAHKEIKINYIQSSSKIELFIDPVMMTTAIQGILDNAVKYGGTVIDIQTELKENYFSLCISDNGKGIQRENLKMIFDKFYRIETDNIHDTKGLGLGLYYAMQIVKAHQGYIEVKSKMGEGSTFKILIPAG